MKITDMKANFDGIRFFRLNEEEVKVEAFTLEIDKGEKNPGSTMGDLYDIIIFSDKISKPLLPERFEAILSSPVHYVETMIENGFCGLVIKSTTNTKNYMDKIFEELNN